MSVRSSILSVLARARTVSAVFAVTVACIAGTPAMVVEVRETSLADLVLIGAGHQSGLRQGMTCRVSRGGLTLAEVVLTEVRSSSSSALIVNLAARQSIRVGDVVDVKTLKSQT